MYKQNVIGVVIPAYNEEDHVSDVISSIPQFVDRIYPVDDRSTDDTWTVIQSAAYEETANSAPETDMAFDRRVVPLRHETNRGVGGAIKTGYSKALEDGVDIVSVMGGDNQMDPSLLQDIIDPVAEGRADYAKGNRFLYEETHQNVPPFRIFGNVLLASLTKVASGYWEIGDSQNGYTAISREALEAIDLDEMYEFYGYCNDLLVKLNVADMVVADVPVPIRYEDENSSIRYRTYVPWVSKMLFRNFLWRLKTSYFVKDFNPIVLLYASGIAGVVLSIARMLRDMLSATPSGSTNELSEFLLSSLLLIQGMIQDKRENEPLSTRETGADGAHPLSNGEHSDLRESREL